MDARSIAATAAHGGVLTAATGEDFAAPVSTSFLFDRGIYEKRVYFGVGKGDPAVPLALGPNIKDWPAMGALAEHLLLKVACRITDPVTTTDELIPSGETSSYRSNPLRLAEFTLSRKDPAYVGRAKAVQGAEQARRAGAAPDAELRSVYATIAALGNGAAPGGTVTAENCALGSAIFANKPGDGSAREQAASCQRVLGGAANFAREYATKRYRSNLINWGILPFLVDQAGADLLALGAWVFVPGIRAAVLAGTEPIRAWVLGPDAAHSAAVTLKLGDMTATERQILADGCLINYYGKR
jgi:aconitate hydratase